MAQLGADFSGREWDTIILDLDGTSHFWLAMLPIGAADQRWWEGDRVLLATMTFKVEDTMTVCIDTAFWPPATSISFARSDGQTYVPRDNLPKCFTIGVPPAPCVDPVHFVFRSNTGDSYSLVVDSAFLDGLELEECDEIGVFADTGVAKGLLCVGASVYHPGEPNIPVTAWKDDPLTPERDGYTAGDTMYFRVWSKNQNREEEACAYYSVGDGRFETGFFSELWLDAPGPCVPPDTIPAAPTNCGASDSLCDRVGFCWQDNSDNETGFYIYRDGSKLDSVGANVTCYDDTSATPGTTYEYCVTAYNSYGESDSCCDSGTRLAVPSAPTNGVASDTLCDRVHFCWQDNSDNEMGFYIYRDGSKLDSVGADVTCYDDFGATPGVVHTYCVTAYNECGESESWCDDGTMLSQAVTVTAPNGGEDWCVGTDHEITWTSQCIDSVKIEYSTDGGSSWITVVGSTVSDGSYFWTVPDTPSSNCLVRICDAEDNTPCDQSDAVFTISGSPAAPTNCVASDTLCDKVHFCWQDNSDNETGFYIYRDGSKLDSVGADVTCYDDFSATPGVTYEYCVTAYNQCGESDSCCDNGIVSTEAITVTAPNGGETWYVGDTYDITWTSRCVDTVKIDYSTDGGSSWTTIVGQTPAAPGSYSWTVPNTPSTNCLVRICDFEDNTPCDQSDAVFTIATPPQQDFSLDVFPDTLYLPRGGDSSYTVVLTSINGFSSPCTLEVAGLPGEVTGSFDDPILTPTDTTGLNVFASDTADTGFYTLTITATELTGGKQIEHSKDVTLVVTLGTWAFYLEAYPDTQKVIPGDTTAYEVLVVPNTGFNAPCTLSVESGLPSGTTYDFDPNPIPPGDTSILTIFTSQSTPAGVFELTIKGVANPKQESTTTVILMVQDFAISASPDTQYVTPGQAVGYQVVLNSLFGFDRPCTLSVTGLPAPPDSGVFDQSVLTPTDSTTLNVYTTAQTDTGWYPLTITAQSMPGAKITGVEHSVEVILRVTEAGDAGDWTDNSGTPKSFALFQNQPNPFNPETKISYYLPRACMVRLTVYNVLGQRVRTLFDGYQNAGMQTVIWNGRNDDGVQLSSGIYFYRLQADNFQKTRKMVLMK